MSFWGMKTLQWLVGDALAYHQCRVRGLTKLTLRMFRAERGKSDTRDIPVRDKPLISICRYY
jgi:hypothetical protein